MCVQVKTNKGNNENETLWLSDEENAIGVEISSSWGERSKRIWVQVEWVGKENQYQ